MARWPTQDEAEAQQRAAHLDAIVDPDRRRDAKTLCSMMEDITHEKPVMWGESMVGFGTYHYVGSSGREGDWPLVAFAARKDKVTVYLMDGFESRTELMERLGRHTRASRACTSAVSTMSM